MCNALPDHEVAAIHGEAQRHAYNAAFEELGLTWHWDAATYARLVAAHGGRACVRTYLESDHPHLLRAYDADFLVNAIETARGRFNAGKERAQHRASNAAAWTTPEALRLAA